ncbi:MAG TPA: DUF1565 domain-containing protein [Polyangiaceae bacterium]|nr:DUF1565 domain-containing protein [Polyangiaceae bacterium]
MRLGRLSGMCVVSLLAAAVAFTACGSSDQKKKVPNQYQSGGEGGDAGAGEPTSGSAGKSVGGGGSGGTGGTVMNDGGVGGVPIEPQGGAAGAPDLEPLGGAGGAGGDGTVVPFHGLYVGPTGDDANGDGTVGNPFASLAKVVGMAKAGDTIVFLDGTYKASASQLSSTVIPDGVNVMAETPGAVTLQGAANLPLFKLAGSSSIEGIHFLSFQTVVQFVDGATATGSLTIKDSSFQDCAVQCLLLSGTTTTNIDVAADAVLGDGTYNFAILSQQANLSIAGGIFQNFSNGNVVNATDDAVVTLDDVSFTASTSKALLLDKKASAHLSHVTMATGGAGLITQKGQSALTIADSDLSLAPNDKAGLCLRLEMDGVGSTEVTDSKLHDCNTGFSGSIPATLTLTRVEAYDMNFAGIDLGGGAGGAGVVVRIVDSNFHDFGSTALRINNGANFTDLKFRGTKFIVSDVKSTWDAVTLQTSVGSNLDLGTATDPGGNTFLVANVNNTALRLGTQGTAMKAKAVGNTWIPNVQNADAQGHYNAPAGAGMKLEDSSGTPGHNYAAPYAGSSILLAQNP